MARFILEEDKEEAYVGSKPKEASIASAKTARNIFGIIVMIVLIAAFIAYFVSVYKETMEENQLTKTEIEMPNVAGFDVDSAREYLESLGFIVTVEYEEAAYTTKDVVIKSEPSKGEIASENDVATLFVSSSGSFSHDTVKLVNTDFFKDNISISDIRIDDEYLVFEICNKTDEEVNCLSVTIAYNDINGNAKGKRRFFVDKLSLQSGETTAASVAIKNIGAYSVELSDISILE